MTPRRLLGLLLLVSTLCACDEKSCGAGGGGAAASKAGFNASKLSAPEPAKLGRPDCKSGMCPLQASAKAVEKSGADRFVGAAPSDDGSLTSLEGGAARLARQFDGSDLYADPAPAKSSRPGWTCEGGSCRRKP